MRIARPTAYLLAATTQDILDRAITALEAFHAREPWSMGGTSVTLARTLDVNEALLIRILALYAHDGRISHRAGYYATLTHEPRLSAEQRAFFDEQVPNDPAMPFLPGDFASVALRIKGSTIVGLSKAFDMLFARGVFVKVGDGLYRGSQIEAIHRKVDGFLTAHERMTMADFRDLLATSRKFAVPLLEWFDGRGITVRSGDYRMLRARKNTP